MRVSQCVSQCGLTFSKPLSVTRSSPQLLAVGPFNMLHHAPRLINVGQHLRTVLSCRSSFHSLPSPNRLEFRLRSPCETEVYVCVHIRLVGCESLFERAQAGGQRSRKWDSVQLPLIGSDSSPSRIKSHRLSLSQAVWAPLAVFASLPVLSVLPLSAAQ